MDRIGFWNARGLNKPHKQKEMNLFMNNQRVGLFGLLETKIKRAKAQQAAFNLCNGWSFTTNLVKHPGGKVWVVWKSVVYDVNITWSIRRQLWEDIKRVHQMVKGPWAIMGDFNSILSREDRVGSSVTMTEIREFKKCMEEFSTQDMRSSGAYYTWSNKQPGYNRVMSRIDRVLVNYEWMIQLPASEVHYMQPGLYDHSPGIINWEGDGQQMRKSFKYFNMWNMAWDFKERIKEGWRTNRQGTQMYQLVGKLHGLKSTLKRINKERFSNIEKRADEALDIL
ncbi:uncharacterized protein [Nicotiana tomentosiformis]|uniref:uncharacterized protein n=1 Tax=Nicotiana tomentosiformis TaxID=4098 RepID=UPI00388CA023